MSTAQLDSLVRNWTPISTLICVPRTDADYQRLVALLDEITDEVGEDEDHPLASFMDLLGTIVEDYESSCVPELA
jgi:HTH-type transcriptional regulator/antitoxin HigA